MPQYTQIESRQQIQVNQQEDIQEMLGNPPGWILHSGISIVFLVVEVALIMSWLIKYPDKMEASVIIRTEFAPTELVTLSSGILDTLFVNEGGQVKKGTIVGVIENTAIMNDVFALEKAVDDIYAFKTSVQYAKIQLDETLELGELQRSYAQISQAIKDLQYFLNSPAKKKQVRALQKEILQVQKLNQSLQEQEQILSQETDLVKKDYERNQKLYDQKVLSALEMENKESEYLLQQRSLEQMKTSQIQNDIRVQQLRTQVMQLKQDHDQEEKQKINTLKQLCNGFQAEVQQWKLKYLLIAPIDGELVYTPNVFSGLSLSSGQKVGTILPELEENAILGYAQLSSEGIGKVQVEGDVHISLSEWPQKEYGSILAKVKEISAIAENTENGYQYQLQLAIPIQATTVNTQQDSILTTYQKYIPFHQNMTGVAHVITEDKSILTRIFDQVLDIVKNS